MTAIWTTKGFLPEDELTQRNGGHDNKNETMTYQEWWLGDELVKRDVQVKLKRGHGLPFEQGTVG